MLRHLSATCLAALLALIVVADRTSAKPPDLPDDDPIIVSTPEPTAAPVGRAVDGSFLFMIDLLPEFCRKAEPERITTMPKIESECPFCSTPTDRRSVTAADLKDMPSVMDNLRALQKAAKEIDRAQKLGAAGKTAKAMKHLEKARKLCPGSSYARRADEVKQELDTARIKQLLNQSDDVRTIELEWEKIWLTDPPPPMTYERVYGGIDSELPESVKQADTTPCPVSSCPRMTEIHNIGACWMSQVTSYYVQLESTAAKSVGCCGGFCGTNYIAVRSISIKFDSTPLLVVSEQLSKHLCMPVQLDPVALQMRGLSMHLPITARIENMPVLVALDVICRPLGLEARFCDGQICITSPLIKGCGKCCSAEAGEGESSCPKCEKIHSEVIKRAKPTKKATGVNSDSGLTGSIILNERNFDCQRVCPAAGDAEPCESACPKCEKMHRELMKKAAESKKVAGVKEQVDGLMKACYFAVREGRTAKAADLARQAHALDPKRVEADPLVYKLHVNVEEGQCEECETPRGAQPACPACPIGGVEGNLSLRPALPAIDPAIVPALDRVLTAKVDAEFDIVVDPPMLGSGSIYSEATLEAHIREETLSRETAKALPCVEVRESCRPCCKVAKAVGMCCLDHFLCLPPKDFENGYVVFGFSPQGINGHCLSKYAGMKILVQYHNGLPLIWVKYDPDSTVTTNE